MAVERHEPRLHYTCIDEGFYYTRDFMTLACTTVSALGEGDTGGNMDFEQWHSLFRLMQLLSNTLEKLHKDYQALYDEGEGPKKKT
jgi:hypothetical protein